MVRSLIRKLFSRVHQKIAEPWACLEVMDFEADGRVKMQFDFNPAFVKKINELGFQAETPEDSVQLFFLASALRPLGMEGNDMVQPDEAPNLSSPQNILMK